MLVELKENSLWYYAFQASSRDKLKVKSLSQNEFSVLIMKICKTLRIYYHFLRGISSLTRSRYCFEFNLMCKWIKWLPWKQQKSLDWKFWSFDAFRLVVTYCGRTYTDECFWFIVHLSLFILLVNMNNDLRASVCLPSAFFKITNSCKYFNKISLRIPDWSLSFTLNISQQYLRNQRQCQYHC